MIPKRALILRFLAMFAVSVVAAGAAALIPFLTVTRGLGFLVFWTPIGLSIAGIATWSTRNQSWVVREEELPPSELVEP